MSPSLARLERRTNPVRLVFESLRLLRPLGSVLAAIRSLGLVLSLFPTLATPQARIINSSYRTVCKAFWVGPVDGIVRQIDSHNSPNRHRNPAMLQHGVLDLRLECQVARLGSEGTATLLPRTVARLRLRLRLRPPPPSLKLATGNAGYTTPSSWMTA
jgi:hypothetical protein